MRKAVAMILIAAVVIGLAACSAEQKILGTWKNQTSALGVVVETTYTFREDGTGTLSTFLVSGLEFTYSISGEELIISTGILGMESQTKYQISFRGDELTMTSEGEALTLVKVK